MNGALILVSATGAVLLGEVTIRLLAPQQLILIRPDIWQAADTFGWLHRPNVQTQINTGERTVDFFTDRDGYRVGRNGRKEAETRILLLGDSFMEALQVDYEQSFAGLLEDQLPRSLDRPVAVRNAAVVGWGPQQYYLRARSLLERDTFDLVVTVLYVDNDLILRRKETMPPLTPVERKTFRFPRKVTWDEFVDAFLAPVNDVLEVRSHLFVLLKSRLETLRMRLGLTPAYLPAGVLRTEASSPRWKVTAETCRDIAELAAAQGTPSVFILVPASYQVDEDVFKTYLKGFNIDPEKVDLDQPSNLLAQSLAAHELNVIDGLAFFRTVHAQGVRLYGEVDRHFTPEGHAALASLVTENLATLVNVSSVVVSDS